MRASYYLSFVSLLLLAMGIVFELPIFILALVRLRVLTSAKLRRNRRIGYVAHARDRDPPPERRPRLAAFETMPLIVLFEASIWLSVLMERRWERSWDESLETRDRLRRLGAAGRCAADRGRRGRDRRTGRSWPSGRPRSSARASASRRGDPAGLRQRALAPRVRGLRGLRRRPRVRRRGSDCTSSASARLGLTEMEAIARLGPRSASPRASRRSATRASPAPRRPPAPSSACGRSSTSRSSAADARSRERFEPTRDRSRARCRTACASGSRPTRPTRAAGALRAPASSSACRSRRISPRAPRSTHGCRGERRRLGAVRDLLVPPLGTTGIRALADAACSTPGSSPPTASTSTRRRSSCSCAHDVAVAHCPRSNALPRLRRRAARVRCSRPASASASARTAPPRRRASTSSTSCARPSSARARASSRARCALPRPRRWSSRPSAQRARSGSTTRSARSRPASRRT